MPSTAPVDAYSVAAGISARGPRPAASAAEARAHRRMRRIFSGAGLRVAVQGFAVPGLGRSRNVIGIVDTPREERSPSGEERPDR